MIFEYNATQHATLRFSAIANAVIDQSSYVSGSISVGVKDNTTGTVVASSNTQFAHIRPKKVSGSVDLVSAGLNEGDVYSAFLSYDVGTTTMMQPNLQLVSMQTTDSGSLGGSNLYVNAGGNAPTDPHGYVYFYRSGDDRGEYISYQKSSFLTKPALIYDGGFFEVSSHMRLSGSLYAADSNRNHIEGHVFADNSIYLNANFDEKPGQVTRVAFGKDGVVDYESIILNQTDNVFETTTSLLVNTETSWTDTFRLYNDSLTNEYSFIIDSRGLGIRDMKSGKAADDIIFNLRNEADERFFRAYNEGSVQIGTAANNTEIRSDGEINLNGTARVEKILFFPLSKMKKGIGNPPAENTSDGFRTFDFDDSTEEEVFADFYGPLDWDSTSDADFYVHFFVDTAPTTAQNVVWGIEYKSIASDGIFDFTSGTSTITDTVAITTGTPANDKKVHNALLTIPYSGLVAGGLLMVRIYRDATNVSDTYTNDVRVNEIDIHYIADKLGEAI